MRRLLAFVALAGCKGHHDAPPAPAPRSAPAPAPAAPATLAPGQKLAFSDFWTIAGVSRTDTAETIIQKWGKPTEQGHDGNGNAFMRYESGPTVTFLTDHSIEIDFVGYGADALTFGKTHPDAKLALLGMSCEDAAKHLAFTDNVEAYTTCKHYDANGWLVDVTMLCPDKVTSLVVVWNPLGDTGGQAMPADHCGDLPR